jgi:biopolymer transport protein ExbD
MSLTIPGQFRSSVPSFNMTPVIDMVFLLIIFFSLVFRFIEAESFPVTVPDNCRFAQNDPESRIQVTTVTVMKTAEDEVIFAVGAEKVTASGYADKVRKMSQLIDIRLSDLPPERRAVTLRIDRDICFAEAQYALAAIAASSATDIQLATLKGKHITESQ